MTSLYRTLRRTDAVYIVGLLASLFGLWTLPGWWALCAVVAVGVNGILAAADR